jgi:competence protein ComEC
MFVGTLALGRAPEWCRQPDAFKPSGLASLASGTLELTFLDVGQGDSAVIRFPGGQIWTVDAGGIRDQHAEDDSSRALDIGELVVSRFLWHRWAPRLDRVVMSHPHQDHAGGIPAVLRNFGAGQLDHCSGGEDPFQAYVLQVAAGLGIPTTAASRGDKTQVAEVEVRTLHPPANTEYESGNESSIVLALRYGKFRALLTGDLEKAGERQLLSWRDDLQSQMLKVAHHGSRYATPDEVLERVGPRWAVVSAGRNNPFGNPARELLMRLLRHGTRPLLTMDHGAIRFSTDGHSYILQSYVCGLLDAGPL